MLMAEHGEVSLALACSIPWACRTVGFAGKSGGVRELREHFELRHRYDVAEFGNVALTGEIDLSAGGEFVLAVGFGRNVNEAGHRARASLEVGFEPSCEHYCREWIDWQESLSIPTPTESNAVACRVDSAILATHESKDFSGGVIASLSLPWGEIHGDQDVGGYHLVWPRDAYESGSALLALGSPAEARRALDFFAVTQEADGHWPQNMWLDGTKFGKSIQLDEVAAPLLLFDLGRRIGRLAAIDRERLWPMIRGAAAYIAANGPSTLQDRWEEEGGLTPYTLATTIAALLIAAEAAEESREAKLAEEFRKTADTWNASIERWLYVEGTELARAVGVRGYYVRLVPPPRSDGKVPVAEERIKIVNSPQGDEWFLASAIVSVDALALVRFGLRAADDPRMVDTVRVIDAVLKVETPSGPCWRRYNHDGYGEHEDGTPYNGTGVGRGWPPFSFWGEARTLRIGAAFGNLGEARRLAAAMEAMASKTGLLPEQIWDTEAIPALNLTAGRPTGSARPLVWAHAEHAKLVRSIGDGRVFDMPPQTVFRYLKQRP